MDASKLIERRAQAANTYRSNWQPRDASEVTLRKVQMSQKNNSSTHKGPVVECCSESRIVTTSGGEPQYNWNSESTAGLIVENLGGAPGVPVLGPGPADVTFNAVNFSSQQFVDSPIAYNVNGAGNTCSLQFRLPAGMGVGFFQNFLPNFYDFSNPSTYIGIQPQFPNQYTYDIINTLLGPSSFGTLNLNPNDLIQLLLDGTNFIIFVNGVEQFRQNYSSVTLPMLIAELYMDYVSDTSLTFSNISYGPITITESTITTITQVPTRRPRASSPTPGFSTDYSEQIVFQKKAGCAQCHDPNFGKAGGVQLLSCNEVATILAPVPNPIKGVGCYCADPGIYQQPFPADCSIIEPAYTGSLNQVPIIKAQDQNHGHLPKQQYPYPSG